MKKIMLFLVILTSTLAFSQVGIGTSSIDASAILELDTTNKALLLTRVANTTAISTPTDGMIIYAENPKCFKGYANNTWVDLTPCTPIVSAITVASPTYTGSVVGGTGVGYNGENMLSTATITISVTVTEPTTYSFSAIHPATGLTYSATGSFAAAGTYPVILLNNNAFIPATTYGNLTLPLTGANNALNLVPRIDVKSISSNGWVEGVHFQTITIGSQIWMDRNLGAYRAPTAIDDPLARGSMFQWGRAGDGHEIMVAKGDDLNNSNNFRGFTGITSVMATTDTALTNEFITNSTNPKDWTTTNNNNRWNAIPIVNNPCPSGYRVPTKADFTAAGLPAAGIVNAGWVNPLKLTHGGRRVVETGAYNQLGFEASYWTSNINGTSSDRYLYYSNTNNNFNGFTRGGALNVRCIKN